MHFFEKKHLLVGLFLLLALIFGIGYRVAQVKETAELRPIIPSPADSAASVEADSAKDEAGAADAKASPPTVTVYIAGAVERPGVYTFPEGSRIHEAVEQAGPTKEAELTYLNLAEIMMDQQQIIVPRKDQAGQGSQVSPGTGGGTRSAGAAQPAGKVNINTAGAAALEKLPGIGPATARKIIEYRTQHGPFRDIADLMKVSGIGEKKFARIKDMITI